MFSKTNSLIIIALVLSVYGSPIFAEEYKKASSFLTSCKGSTAAGIYTIRLDDESRPFPVFCDQKGWILVLLRKNGNIDFTHRAWPEFKFGFGNMSDEFFIGLDKLNALTSAENYELKIIMHDFENGTYTTTFESFKVADETHYWSTGDMVNGAKGIDVGLSKSNAFCTASSKQFCEHLVPGWQPNPAFKQPKALLHIFGFYPEYANDTRIGRMGLYLYDTAQLRPLSSIKMLITPRKLSSGYPVFAEKDRKYDRRFFSSSFDFKTKKTLENKNKGEWSKEVMSAELI